MIEHVSVTEFVDRFGAIDRAENFSIPARRALFAYFEKLEDGGYALRYASEHGHTEVVKVLLKNGADVHARDDYAIRWALENGHIEVVKILLKNS